MEDPGSPPPLKVCSLNDIRRVLLAREGDIFSEGDEDVDTFGTTVCSLVWMACKMAAKPAEGLLTSSALQGTMYALGSCPQSNPWPELPDFCYDRSFCMRTRQPKAPKLLHFFDG